MDDLDRCHQNMLVLTSGSASSFLGEFVVTYGLPKGRDWLIPAPPHHYPLACKLCSNSRYSGYSLMGHLPFHFPLQLPSLAFYPLFSLTLLLEWAVPRMSRLFHGSIALWVLFPLSGALFLTISIWQIPPYPLRPNLKQLLLSNPPHPLISSKQGGNLFSGTKVPRLGFLHSSLALYAFVCMPISANRLSGPQG